MKKTLIKAISILVMVATLLTAVPLSASAASKNCSVTYYRNDLGKEIGIKEIKINDKTYYDCSGNKSVEIDSAYLNKLLTKDVVGDSFGSILSEWSNIASAIFDKNGKYTFVHYDDDDETYNSRFRKGTKNIDSNCDVVSLLSNPKSVSGGKVGCWCHSSTGLMVADSLGEVRSEMANEIARGINQDNCSGSNLLGQGDFDAALSTMGGHDKAPVLYNIVASVDSDRGSYLYSYNAYGVAFYDFKLAVLADEFIDYVIDTDCDGGALTLDNLNTVTSQVVSQVNDTAMDSTIEITTENSSSETITTSMEHSKALSFEQSVGMEASFEGIGGLSTNFTVGEALTTTQGEENSATHSSSSSVTSSVVVPAYTQAVLEQECGDGISHLSYNVPVALNFKVAIFSMSGDVYADGLSIRSMSTDNYIQKYFYTTFGEKTGNAYEDLRYRVENSSSRGVDTKTGTTKVFFGEHGIFSDDIEMPGTYDLNWTNIGNKFTELTSYRKKLTDFYLRLPMMATGAESVLQRETYKTKISEFQPLYLPRTIRATNLADIKQNVKPNSTINLNRIDIDAFNQYDVSYYGFVLGDGHWEICEGSEDVFEMTSGTNTLTVTGKDGDVGCVKWVLNDGVEYTAVNEQEVVTKDTIAPLIIQFSVMNDVTIIN